MIKPKYGQQDVEMISEADCACNQETASDDEWDQDFSQAEEDFENLKMNKERTGNQKIYIPSANKPKKSEEQIRYEFMRLFQDGNATKPSPFA